MMRRLAAAGLLAIAMAGAAAPPVAAAEFDLAYTASILNVVTLGEASLKGSLRETSYVAAASLRTAGAAAIFDNSRIQASSTGAIALGGLGWSRYELSHAYAEKFRRVAMRRQSGAVSATIQPPFGEMGSPPATEAQKAASLDPVSGLVQLSRLVAGQNACGGRVAVFDGRQHYTLSLSPKTRGSYRGGGYDGVAIVCHLRYSPVSGFETMSAQARARIPIVEAWFAAPQHGFAPLLRLEAPTPVGALRIDLARWSLRE